MLVVREEQLIPLAALIGLFGSVLMVVQWIRKGRDRKRCSRVLKRLWGSNGSPASASALERDRER
jgi:hypothetical protein